MENIIQNNEASNQSSTITPSLLTEDVMDVFEVNEQVDSVSQDSVDAESSQQSQEIEIDERFKHLDKTEGLIRTLQSRYDKLYNEHQKLVKEQEENAVYLQILNDLLEDDLVFEAFVRERKPELIKETDITSIIQQRLKSEFGDVRYTRAEADENPGGKAWLYFKRLDELYDEYKGNTPKVQTLKEAIQLKKQMREKQEKEMMANIQRDMEAVKKEMKWDDEHLVRFQQWAQKLKLVDLAKMFNFAIRTKKIPSIASVNVGQPTFQSLRSKFISNL